MQGLQLARRVIAQPSLAAVAYESYPGDRVQSYEQFRELLLKGGLFRKGSHYFAGVTLGSALDHKLRVKGLVS